MKNQSGPRDDDQTHRYELDNRGFWQVVLILVLLIIVLSMV